MDSQKIAITGASGFLGTAVADRLRGLGHSVTRLVRSRDAAHAPDALYWRPDQEQIDAPGLAGHQVVLNLAGESIFGLWTPAKKRRIRSSRLDGTAVLARTLAALPAADRPHTFMVASAVGFYGDRERDQALTEDASPGDTFLARVLIDMEAATGIAAEAGIRVVMLRFAPVVDPESPLLGGLVPATRVGMGATLGSGRQGFPWVTRNEIAHVVPFVLEHTELEGPVNVVAPQKTSNAEFVDTLARVLDRPRLLRVPAPLVRLLGDLGKDLLVDQWVVPAKLQSAGYQWRDPELEPALRRML
jgi:uncharacterized protein